MKWPWRKSKHVVCKRCHRINPRGTECGTLKIDRQDFGDSGWVEWRSWNPCTAHAPGGVVPPKPMLLDECGDLDDVMNEIAANGGAYGSIRVT